jgi:hypothetical protein
LLSCSLTRRLGSGYLPQVVREYPPSYPSLHPFFSVIEAQSKPEATTQHANASLDARPETEASPEPALLFVAFSLLGGFTVLGQDYMLHTRLPGGFLVLSRIETPVASQEERRLPETLLMRPQTPGKLGTRSEPLWASTS